MSLLGSGSFGLPRLRPLSHKRSSIVTVLDIGTAKVVCMIAELTPTEGGELLAGRTHSIRVIGIGHQKSRGMKGGLIADLDAVEGAIRLAVDAAERMAGVTVDSLIVNVSSSRLRSDVYSAAIDLGGHEVDAADLKRVLLSATAQSITDERAALHSLATGYALDGERGIREPLGMFGDELGVDMHVVTADKAPLKNIEVCVNRAHLSVEAMVATPYASGLAALVDDEIEMGCAVIDMGAGATTISVFAEGRFVHSDAVAIGGQHVTSDVAHGLSTRFEDAERLKVVHGTAFPISADNDESIPVPPLAREEYDQPANVPRALLGRIVRARIEETLEHIRDRIQRSGYGPVVGKRVVLTGGASQLTGLTDAARRILARNVRIGRPLGVAGLPVAAKGPAFSTAAGMLVYPQVADIEVHGSGRGTLPSMVSTGNRIARVGQWLKQSF
ncbi:cell division protein FtsA [Pararhizobium mangrovi]|uniref:Cell division protein FtsA n=1 Tax=Pararhizobium mangrovi TaxID=2590452 RepID=A0A506U843_9HYPH|nr:cell division protein FtsA [Pararhizobium mangrovi]TPW29271.1 cell division protein FtsA [Pararhizobium mangrovi]